MNRVGDYWRALLDTSTDMDEFTLTVMRFCVNDFKEDQNYREVLKTIKAPQKIENIKKNITVKNILKNNCQFFSKNNC